MAVASSLAKASIGILSTLFFLIGIGFLTIIGIVTVEFKLYASGELFKDIYLWAPVGVGFVVGALLMLCGALGLGGICCEKRGLLKAFSVLMFLLVVLEIVAGVLIYVYRSKLSDEVNTSLQHGISRAYRNITSTSSITREALNKLQINLKCCGSNSTADYTSQGLNIPKACCVGSGNCTTSGPFYTSGCSTKLSDLYSDYATITFGIAVAFAVLEIFTLIYSCVAGHKSEVV